jgi:hypothetical protein
MQSTFEKYKGINIEIRTFSKSNGQWTARAEFRIPGNVTADTNSEVSEWPSEQEARQAALQAAIEKIDRSRIAIGKP